MKMFKRSINTAYFWDNTKNETMVTMQIDNGQIRIATEKGVKTDEAVKKSWKSLEDNLRKKYL